MKKRKKELDEDEEEKNSFYLHEVNDYFMENYTDAFENPNDIEIHKMYKIDAGSSNIKLVSID